MSMTLETIRAAHARIAPYIVQTPLLRLPALDDALGCEVYAKAECMQRTGAFKLRGAMNKILALTEDERARGFVAASSGNHGRAVAYAAQRFGTHACIVMPETAPAVKQAAIRALGAELVLCEASERFDVAARRRWCRRLTTRSSWRGRARSGSRFSPSARRPTRSLSRSAAAGSSAASPRRSRRSRRTCASTVQSRRHCRAIGRACAPGIRCRWSSILDPPAFTKSRSSVKNAVKGYREINLRAMKLLLLEGKLLCEPSSAIGMGAALCGQLPLRRTDKVCFVISGGSVALEQLHQLEDVAL